MREKKIITAASFGGHWIQLLRIAKPLEEYYNVVYISTHIKCQTMVDNSRFYTIMDFNRWNAWKMIPTIFKILVIIIKERPCAILSTGAAPGLLTIVVGRLCGVKTIWIDSIANVKTMSVCGNLARKLANLVYTQWPTLAKGNIQYAGNIFGD